MTNYNVDSINNAKLNQKSYELALSVYVSSLLLDSEGKSEKVDLTSDILAGLMYFWIDSQPINYEIEDKTPPETQENFFFKIKRRIFNS